MNLKMKNLKPRIGVQIEADLDTLLSGRASERIRDLLEERGVILFRDLEMTDHQQVAFSKTLGTIESAKSGEVYKVSQDKKVNPLFAELNLGNFSWHMDRTDLDMPNRCSILRPEKLSPTGGETQFANTYAAYEDLSAEEKAFIDDLKVVHRVESSFREKVPNPTAEQLARWRSYPPKTHPLVWHHRSGRNSLALSTSATEVVGMSAEDGQALLRRLMAWSTRPEYVYTHEWQMGDLLVWDNTGTMHKVLPYDPDSGRCLHRTTLVGEEALA